MGAGESIPQEQLNELIHLTNFKKEEIKRWFSRFIKDYPDGQLTREEFASLFRRLCKSGCTENLANHIFRSFDANNDNLISFKELMCSFSVTSRGTVRDKLQWAFTVYDVDGNGSITVEEIDHMMKCMQQAANYVEKDWIADDDIASMFNAMDVNKDGRLTMDEFVEGVQKNATFVDMLNGVNT